MLSEVLRPYCEKGPSFQTENDRRLERFRVPGLRSPPEAENRRGAYLYHREIDHVNKKIQGSSTFILAESPTGHGPRKEPRIENGQ